VLGSSPDESVEDGTRATAIGYEGSVFGEGTQCRVDGGDLTRRPPQIRT